MKIKLMILLLLLTACNASDNETSKQSAATIANEIFLVRHAEKQTGNDPSLTPEGRERATTLARILGDKGLTHIHSTNYRRTIETAAPIAAQTGLEIEQYDPRDLASFADELRAAPGIHLVVGHSNTTPQLAEALGGEPGSPIDEQSEYDRLYVISLNGQDVTSTIERFGVRYQKDTLETAH